MPGESPDVVLYDVNGNQLAVQNATPIVASTPALMIAGSDGTNSRYFTLDASGRVVVVGAGIAGTPTGGVLTIQGIAGGTTVPISGIITANQGISNTLANAWATKITDTTNGPVAVKPANTSAIASDPSLVVSLTPNLPTAVTISSANINANANGNNTLIAGIVGKTIRIFKVALVFSAGGVVIFQDGGSTALTGSMSLYTGATMVLDMDVTNPWFLTSSGNSFVINLSGGASVGGVIYYTQS
jgi:hypothetical protein